MGRMKPEIPNLTRPVEDDPCFAIYGELVRMLDEDMTIRQAVEAHCANFNFVGPQNITHDFAHLILGFAQLKMGRGVEGVPFSYNGNWYSEGLVAEIERPLNDYIRYGSASALPEAAEFGESAENFKTISSIQQKALATAWTLASATKGKDRKTGFEVFRDYQFDNFRIDTENRHLTAAPDTKAHFSGLSYRQADLKTLAETIKPGIQAALDYMRDLDGNNPVPKNERSAMFDVALSAMPIRAIWAAMPDVSDNPAYKADFNQSIPMADL